MMRLVAGVGLLVVLSAAAAAQERDRAEIHAGVGSVSHINTSSKLTTFAAGGTLWLGRSLGLGVQHVEGPGVSIPTRYETTTTQAGRLRYTSLTARWRWILDDRRRGGLGLLQVTLGAGIVVGKIDRIYEERYAGRTVVLRREEGPRGLALEAFVGRRLFRRVGVTGGMTLGARALDADSCVDFLGLVSVGL